MHAILFLAIDRQHLMDATMVENSTKHRSEMASALQRLFEAQAVFRKFAPRATVSAHMLFVFLALRTSDKRRLELPTQIAMAEAIGVTQSNVNQLLASMTVKGRAKTSSSASSGDEGYGLIETNDWIQGRRFTPYVLTEKGRACVTEMMTALLGHEPAEEFRPHDMNSLFKLLLVQTGGGEA